MCKVKAEWNILDQTLIDSKFHNNFLLHQGFHTTGQIWPTKSFCH